MPPPSLLLSQPLSRDAIELGRLVANPYWPSQESKQPDVIAETGKQPLNDLKHTLNSERGTSFKLSLLQLFHVSPSNRDKFSTTLSGRKFMSYELRNSDTYFRNACREPKIREFLEERAQKLFGKAYLVCGFQTIEDAHVELTQNDDNQLGGGFAVTASQVAGAAAGIPVFLPPESDVDVVALEAELKQKRHQLTEFNAPGEQVFAVQYRKVNFAFFATDKVGGAFLEAGNRWKLYGALRGEGGEDGIEADIGESAALAELAGDEYESIGVDGETFVFRVGGGAGEEKEEEITKMRH